MKRVLVAVPDLLFGVQIANAVRTAGGDPHLIRTSSEAGAILAAEPVAAVIVDLGGRIASGAVIQAAAGQGIPVFAFGPHLQAAAIRAARAAGAEKVVANSALADALPGWLAAHLTRNAEC